LTAQESENSRILGQVKIRTWTTSSAVTLVEETEMRLKSRYAERGCGRERERERETETETETETDRDRQRQRGCVMGHSCIVEHIYI
jgi:hypothetical protein